MQWLVFPFWQYTVNQSLLVLHRLWLKEEFTSPRSSAAFKVTINNVLMISFVLHAFHTNIKSEKTWFSLKYVRFTLTFCKNLNVVYFDSVWALKHAVSHSASCLFSMHLIFWMICWLNHKNNNVNCMEYG